MSVSVPARSPGWGSISARTSRLPGWLPNVPTPLIAAVATVLALAAGHFFGDGRMTIAAALVLGVCYAPLVLLNLPLAFAIYVTVLFLKGIQALSIGPNTIGVLIILAWLGTIVTRSARPVVVREQWRLMLALAAFALWLTLSVTWAASPAETGEGLIDWLLAILAFAITVTTLRTPRSVAMIAVAFIVGSVISTVYGIGTGALSAEVASANESSLQGRFTGGGGDPNTQAAGFMMAMFLCAGLWSVVRTRAQRAALLVAFVVVTVGFFATESRGGLLGLAFAAIAGLFILPGQRKRLVGLTGAAAIGLGIVAASNPKAVSRMTDFGGGTSGRSDIWAVALKIFSGHPWVGIGLNNFEYLAPRYVLKSGPLMRVELIAEVPHLVHNLYLQLLTETGIVGLLLFATLAGACLRAAWLAARDFDARGKRAYGDLARAVLLAGIAMLTAEFFISDGDDGRLWILLALGPVLLSLARRSPARDAQRAAPPDAERRTLQPLTPRAAPRGSRRRPLGRAPARQFE